MRLTLVLDDLLAFSGPLRDPIRGSGSPQAQEVETLLDSSALHLASAAFGARLEDAWDVRGDELRAQFPGAVPHMSAATLVFVGSVSALDQCAAALARWSLDLHAADRECDMGCALGTRRAHVRPPWGEGWLTDTAGDPRWPPIKDARDHLAHRVLSRSAVVGSGTIRHTFALRPLTPSEAVKRRLRDEAAALGIDPDVMERYEAERQLASERTVEQWYGDAIDLAAKRWRVFWQTLAADARSAASAPS